MGNDKDQGAAMATGIEEVICDPITTSSTASDYDNVNKPQSSVA